MRRRREAPPEIITKVNVTPIIDVALVLVIILLVTAPIITAVDMNIQLPEAHTKTAEDQQNVSITLSQDGTLSLDSKKVQRPQLQQALQARLAGGAADRALVLVCADTGVPYARVEELLEEARRAGAKRLGVATKQKAARP